MVQFSRRSLWQFLFILLCLCLICSLPIGSNARQDPGPPSPRPYALSPIYLTFLAGQERKIYRAMKDYTRELQKRLHLLNRYTSDYEESSIAGTAHLEPNSSETQRDEVISSNPILAFRMLSRYAHEFSAVGEHISEGAEEVSSKIVYDVKGDYDFPQVTDSRDAIEALLRMQFMYDIDSADVADGRIPGAESQVGLTTTQCYRLAKVAKAKEFFTLALDWLNVTKSKLDVDPNKSEYSLDEKRLNYDTLQVVKRHDKQFDTLFEGKDEHIFSQEIGQGYQRPPPTLKSKLFEELAGKQLEPNEANYFEAVNVNHALICRGKNLQSDKEKSKLLCWTDGSRNPYWRIRPLKLELLNRSPQILLIHELVSRGWMDYLKKLSYPKLERAPSGPNATPRTAAYAWLRDSDIPAAPISRRIELITGLNVVGEEAAELLQVAAYAFGGHVELHYDSKGPDDPVPDPKGDRVTTLLLYLNTVKEGGRTSFPRLGFGVEPVQGSAILWYTNLQNGQPDPGTLHAACPLIYGHKWIATKWTHANENIFKRPCHTNPEK